MRSAGSARTQAAVLLLPRAIEARDLRAARLLRRGRPSATRRRSRAAADAARRTRGGANTRTWRSARRRSRPRRDRRGAHAAARAETRRRRRAPRRARRRTPCARAAAAAAAAVGARAASRELASAPALHALVPTLNPDAKAWLDDTRTAAQKHFAQQRQVAELAKAVVALNQRATSADAERARLQRVVAQQSRALAASARQLQAEQRGRREQGSELKRTAARAEQLERGLRSVLRAQGAI